MNTATKAFCECLIVYLDEHDPMGLRLKGGPPGEYTPEALLLLRLLGRCRSADEFTNALHGVFIRYFNAELTGPRENYVAMAGEIYHRWSVFKGVK